MAYDDGFKSTASLYAYRAGGGHIRTTDWIEIWHRRDEGSQAWGNLMAYKNSDTIPESMYQRVGIDYRSKYNVVFGGNVRMEDGSILHNQYRTIRSNVRLTLGEIKADINETLTTYAGEYGIENISITSLQFYSPG